MKKGKHPKYQQVLFVDSSNGYKFVCGSTLQLKETETFEGQEYPVYRVPVSSQSHPFFTGSQQFVDSEGRVDKFMKRYGGGKPAQRGGAKQETEAEKPAEEAKEAKPAKEAKKAKPAKEAKEAKPAKEAKEAKPTKEAKEAKPAKEAKEAKPAKDAKEAKPAKKAEKTTKEAKKPAKGE